MLSMAAWINAPLLKVGAPLAPALPERQTTSTLHLASGMSRIYKNNHK